MAYNVQLRVCPVLIPVSSVSCVVFLMLFRVGTASVWLAGTLLGRAFVAKVLPPSTTTFHVGYLDDVKSVFLN